MTPSEIGLYVGQGVTVLVALIALFGKKLRSPADENDSIRLGNEFLRGLLEDARKEREELRKTLEEMRSDRVGHEQTITRLEGLLVGKDIRIRELEDLLESLTEKLRRGQVITIEDLLSTNTGSMTHAA